MAQSDPAQAEWSLVKKQAFCFFFIFFLLYIFLNPNRIVPYSFYLDKIYIQPFTNLVAWLAKDVLHLVDPAIKFYNWTIDTVFGYLALLFIGVTAILGSLIWLLIDRKSGNYNKLYRVLIVILRYYLAVTWIAYGLLKITKLQFPAISPVMLLQTYGNSTPKDLAWAFMGYSTGYNYFIGIIECTAGLLLFFRRTSTLGNIIALAALANVVAFNYSFDVNVKLLTTVLMVMTLFLLSKDFTRLINFFVLNKIVYPMRDQSFRFKKKWKNTALLISKYAFILFIILFDLKGDFARAKQEGANPVKPPLYGIYNVTAFIRNKDTLKPLTIDTIRWNKLIVSAPEGNAGIMFMDNSLKSFVFKADTFKNRLEIFAKKDPSNKYTFIYSQPKDSLLVLRGTWHGDSLEIELRQFDMNKLQLVNSRFRWVIDRNFNNKR